MYFFKLAVAAIASASVVHSLPASGITEAVTQDKRDANLDDQGECNGTSCNFLFQNIPCSQGTSTKQSGAGDGTPCNVYNFGNGVAYAVCPGRGG